MSDEINTSTLKVGDKIYSIHTENSFTVEYVSNDGWCVIINSEKGIMESARCYYKIDIEYNFRHCK